MLPVYRDATEAARHRLREAHDRLGALDQRVTDALVERLPEDLRNPLSRAREEGLGVPELNSADAVRTAEQRLARLEALYAQITELSPELERAYHELPDAVQEDVLKRNYNPLLHGHQISNADLKLLHRELPRRIRQLDPSAQLHATPSRPLLDATFRFEGAPFFLTTFSGGHRGGEIEITLATGIRSSTPPLRMRPEQFSHAITKAMGIHRDAQLDNIEIDSRFLIDATNEDARALLTDEVLTALMSLARFDIPTLEIEAGHAIIRWCFDPFTARLRTAATPLLAIRAMTWDRKLLR